MDQYRAVIYKAFPHIHETIVQAPRFGLLLEPWKEWGTNANPGWWQHHQLVKYQRHKYFAHADLEHCIVSVAAFSLALCLCRNEHIGIEPSVFFDMGVPEGTGRSRRYPLLDDPR